MKTLVIVLNGDNPILAREALVAAIEAIEKTNPTIRVYHAYVQQRATDEQQ